MAKTFTHEITILEHHLDTYGHVNNADYLQLFEEARWDLATKQGWGLKRVMEEQRGPIILEIQLQFRKELRLRDQIVIKTHLLEYTKLVGTLAQEMVLVSGEVACKAQLKIGLFDLKRRRLLRPTDEWLRILGAT